VTSRKSRATATIAMLALLTLAGCKGNSGSPATQGASTTGSDPGITKTSVTVGTVATLTGLVPGLFAGAPAGVKAYAAYINSQGGINGRQLSVSVKDDAFSCAQNSQGASALAGSTFALVGSFSIFDNCAETVVAKDPTLPYVGVALSPTLAALPNEVSPEPTPPGFKEGPDRYIVQHYGVKRIGFIAASGAQQQTESYELDAARAAGATAAYSAYIPPTQSDFTSTVIRMKKAQVDWVSLDAVSASTAAEVLQAMHQQNFHPTVITSEVAYDRNFFGLLSNPSIANNVLIPATYAMFLGEDAATTPAVKLFDTWMAKTGSVKPDLYALYGWASAELFAQALKAAGANPTRSSVLAALKNIHSFNGDGLLAPTDPGSKGPGTCWALYRIQNGAYTRATPAKGFTCNPAGYFRPTS
jgi:ABC-type branched-subunit amino acid transport system substrate-binding protein